MPKPMTRFLMQLPPQLIQHLDNLRSEGYTRAAYIRALVEADFKARKEAGWKPGSLTTGVADVHRKARLMSLAKRLGYHIAQRANGDGETRYQVVDEKRNRVIVGTRWDCTIDDVIYQLEHENRDKRAMERAMKRKDSAWERAMNRKDRAWERTMKRKG